MAGCHQMILVTRNRHFLEIDGLTIANWAVCL